MGYSLERQPSEAETLAALRSAYQDEFGTRARFVEYQRNLGERSHEKTFTVARAIMAETPLLNHALDMLDSKAPISKALHQRPMPFIEQRADMFFC